MKQFGVQFSDKTKQEIEQLARLWGFGEKRFTTPVIEAAVTQALRFQQITAAGGSFSEAVAPYRPHIIAAVLTEYMQRCITTDERGDDMTRAIVYDIAMYLGLTREQAEKISETKMGG